MHAASALPSPAGRRLGYAGLAAAFLAATVAEAAGQGSGYWQLAAFGLGPDLALVFGAGAGLARGQLHPRAVPVYNLVHRFWLPAALLGVAAAGVLPFGYAVGGLAWCFHVSLDRALGYGLRTHDGFQRG